MSAPDLATELEVSVRTVLRDLDALSAAGVPVYAERGRYGGFRLLPGFRTELTGLNRDEALALLTTGPGGSQSFGLAAPLASAVRKVLDALPEGDQVSAADAVARFLTDPESDLLSRRRDGEQVPAKTISAVRQAVLAGSKLNVHYQPVGQPPRWRTVDPIGLVTVRGNTYLLATRAGADRTYRLSRMADAEVLDEPADRPDQVDLGRIWDERRTRFLAEDHLSVRVRVDPHHRDALLDMATSLRAEDARDGAWPQLDVTFQDLRHARWALWQLGEHAEALSPGELRDALHESGAALVARYRGPHPTTTGP